MENKTLDNVVNYEHKEKTLFDRIKNGVCYITAAAVLATGTYGCGPKPAPVPVNVEPAVSPYFMGSADIDEAKFNSLDPVSRLQLWEGKKVLFNQEDAMKYASRQKLEEIQAYLESKKTPEQRAAEAEERKKNEPAPVVQDRTWFQKNKMWVIPVAVVAAAGAAYGISKAVDNNKSNDKKKPSKKGSNSNVGPDNGNGNDHDKDDINW